MGILICSPIIDTIFLMIKIIHEPISKYRQYFSWFGKLAFSVADQGMISGSNFILNVILARTMGATEYGIFSIGFSAFLLISGIHNAFILEPMSVLQPKNPQWEFTHYIKTLVTLNFLFTIFAAGVLGLIFWAYPAVLSNDHLTLLGVVLSSPVILLFWLLRRTCYLKSWPFLALQGSFVYGLVLLIGIFSFSRTRQVSSLGAFILLGAASIAAAIFYWLRLRVKVSANIEPYRFLSEIGPSHWNYGKWAVGSAFILSNTVLVPLIGMVLNASSAGVFRAMLNTILPMQQIMTAIGVLFLPKLASLWVGAQAAQLRKYSLFFVLSILALALGYASLLFLFSREIVTVLYNRPEYNQYAWLITYLGVFAILDSVSIGLAILLRSAEKPQAIFWSQVGALAVLAALTFLLTGRFGLQGAAIALIVSGLAMFLILLAFTIRARRPTAA